MKSFGLIFCVMMLIFSVSQAHWLGAGLVQENTEGLYHGTRVRVLEQTALKGTLREFRYGVESTQGQYEYSDSISNLTGILGATFVFGTSYLEWDSEASRQDQRKPFSSHSLQYTFGFAGNELAVGSRYADFRSSDLSLLTLTARHYLSDTSFLAAYSYLSTKNDNLNAYRVSFRSLFAAHVTAEAGYSFGKTLQDEGIEDQFTGVALRISRPISEAFETGLELERVWGQIRNQSNVGITIRWQH